MRSNNRPSSQQFLSAVVAMALFSTNTLALSQSGSTLSLSTEHSSSSAKSSSAATSETAVASSSTSSLSAPVRPEGVDTKSASRFGRTLIYALGCEDFSQIVPLVISDLKNSLHSGLTQNQLENIIFDYADNRTRNRYNMIYEFMTSRVLSIAKLIKENPDLTPEKSLAFQDRVKAVSTEARARGYTCRMTRSEKIALYNNKKSEASVVAKKETAVATTPEKKKEAANLNNATTPQPEASSGKTQTNKGIAVPDWLSLEPPSPPSSSHGTGSIQIPYRPSPAGNPIQEASAYKDFIKEFDIAKFESASCRSVHETTRKMLYEEFVRELLAAKNDGALEKRAPGLIDNYSKLSFVGCAESDGQPFVVSSHGNERSLSFPVTSSLFKDKVKRFFGLKKVSSSNIKTFIDRHSVFDTLTELREYFGKTRSYNEQINVFDHQTNFGVYQISADRMYMEPTRSFLQKRLKDIILNKKIEQYCQIGSFYPKTPRADFIKQFNFAAEKMQSVMKEKSPYQAWKELDRNRDGLVDRVLAVDARTGKRVYVADPEKLKKLESLRSGIWAFADMMAMCPRLNLELGKITMEQFGSRYYGTLNSSQIVETKMKCADLRSNLYSRKGRRNHSQVPTHTCAHVYWELKKRVEIGQIYSPKMPSRVQASVKPRRESSDNSIRIPSGIGVSPLDEIPIREQSEGSQTIPADPQEATKEEKPPEGAESSTPAPTRAPASPSSQPELPALNDLFRFPDEALDLGNPPD